jgi:tRNA 2-thiouridine synthesizing protein A
MPIPPTASIGSCCLAPEDDLPPEDDLAPEDDTETVDARGLKCPLPVLMMEKRLASLPPGARLIVLATDPMAKIDIPLYCRQRGHACTVGDADGVLSFRLAKAGE